MSGVPNLCDLLDLVQFQIQYIMIARQMKESKRQDFSIKCECIITKNNMQVNGKKKSKFTTISLNPQKKLLAAQPFGSQKDQESILFPLAKLKAIHKKYIEEGKLTLEFMERSERVQLKGTDVSNVDERIEVNSVILISSASKENLELLITKIITIKNSQQTVKNTKEGAMPEKEHIKKKPSDLTEIQQKPNGALNRKDLMKSAFQLQKPKIIIQSKKKQMKIGFFDLSSGIIDLIFEFCTLSLDMRVISRGFSGYVLKNIRSIKLKDEVDDKSFNKLSKWAVEVDCRMKNVKNLDLSDKYEQQELVKNRAKTLKFGNWKEITSKNILQLKGLRIYCLQIPYYIKFDLSNLFGMRLVELRLKSTQITSNRCEFVKTQDLVYLLKTIKDLRVLELPYANSDLLTLIENPKKMVEIQIYYLNDNMKDDSWKDLTKFESLKIFTLWITEKLGVKKDNHEITLKLPEGLKQLEIGDYLSKQSLDTLPLSIQYLKLIGQNFLNSHIENIYLPNLKILDITMSRNVRQQILDYMQGLEIVTFWQRNTIDYITNYANSKGIRVSTKNPSFK